MAMKALVVLAVAAVVACVGASYPPPQPWRPHNPQPHYKPQPHYQPSSYVTKVWGAWNHWGRCSKPCGGGIQYRTRTCINKTVYGHGHGSYQCQGSSQAKRYCNLKCCPVNGGWSYWSSWAPSHHGSYQHTRYRTCSKPYPSCHGRQCYGDSTQTKTVHPPRPHYPQPHYPRPHYPRPHYPRPHYPSTHNKGRY